LVLVHVPEQSLSPFEQAQAPFWRDFPPLQAFPQAPQLLSSDWVSTHSPPQSVVPDGQVHTRFSQVRPPLERVACHATGRQEIAPPTREGVKRDLTM
jgi:hypothetical protein